MVSKLKVAKAAIKKRLNKDYKLLLKMNGGSLYYSQEIISREEVLSWGNPTPYTQYYLNMKDLDGESVSRYAYDNRPPLKDKRKNNISGCEVHVIGKEDAPFYLAKKAIIDDFLKKEKNKCADKDFSKIPDAITQTDCDPTDSPGASCFYICNVFLKKKIPVVGEKVHVFSEYDNYDDTIYPHIIVGGCD